MTLPYPQILPVPDNAPAVPATWNTRHVQIDANFADLDGRAVQAVDAIGLLDSRVGTLEGDSSASVSTAVRLDWLYRNFMMVMELWTSHWTLLDPIALAVTGGVAGDDSVDVSTTVGLVAGQEYVLYNSQYQESVVVSEILTGTRFRTTTDLVHSYTTAILKRCNFSFAGGVTTAAAGKLYYCGPLSLGHADQDKAFVIRRQDNDTVLRLYFKDANNIAWTEAHWEWQRTISAGVIDVEYRIPARGDFEIKLAVEAGATTSQVVVYHLAGVYASTGLRGLHRPPETPVNSLPADEAIGVQETPTLSVAAYSHPAGTPLSGLQVQISTDGDDFSSPLFDSGFRPGGITYSVLAGLLAVSTEYFWRARVCDAEETWSEWSTPTGFTTEAVFVYVVTPSNSVPINGAVDIAENPALESGAFAMYCASDTHSKSQWQVRSATGSYDVPVYDSGESADLLSHEVLIGLLNDGAAVYYFRVRHKSTSNGWSQWSSETSFSTLALFTRIFGLAQVATGGGAGTWQHVDANGDNTTLAAAYFATHSVYKNIADVLLDGQAMVKIPKFYFKVGNAPSGSDQDGKKCWWISTAPAAGFVLHPAFKKNGVDVDYFLLGKYEASGSVGSPSSLLYSLAASTPTNTGNIGGLIAAASARGSGWHVMTIYEWAAVQMLCLLELESPDVQSQIAAGNVSGGSVALTGSTAAVWRGLCELWGNTRTFVNGIKITSQPLANDPLQLFDLSGYMFYVPAALSALINGWTTGMRSDSGNEGGGDYNCAAVFIASSVDADEADGSFADRALLTQMYGSECLCAVGGGASDGSSAGMFCMRFDVYYLDQVSNQAGARIAKH